MDRTERIVLLHRLLTSNRYGLSNARLMEEAGCSRATLYRDLAYMRDALGAPLVHVGDGDAKWRYLGDGHGTFQLPGLWLNADELYALLLAQQMLERSGAGMFGQAMGSLQPRIQKLLGDKAHELRRLRVIRVQTRGHHANFFRVVAEAVLGRRQLRFTYAARSTDTITERVVSPQRLTNHRDNWYLDAWDAAQGGLRSFAVDRIRRPTLADEAAVDIAESDLDRDQGTGYGLFSGPVRGTAVIRFSAHAARWVADEQWHPKQQLRVLADGSLELRVPYANPRELMMDVQRYGADAEVLRPPSLRKQMRLAMRAAADCYARKPGPRPRKKSPSLSPVSAGASIARTVDQAVETTVAGVCA